MLRKLFWRLCGCKILISLWPQGSPRLLRPGNAQERLQQEFPRGLPQPVADRVDSTKLQNGPLPVLSDPKDPGVS